MSTRKDRPILLDVARHAGVSPATVSRVLNNTAPVRPSVRERVLASLKSLDYEPPSSRSPSSLVQSTIAVIVPVSVLEARWPGGEAGYRRIGIIDGHFGNVPSVWHKEILFALSKGVEVSGAASMGALLQLQQAIAAG